MSLPSGTVTFLFTDIEGSTRLWEESPDSMRLALLRYDEIAGSLIREFGGALVKSRGEGDSLFAVFAMATDAIGAAAALQAAYTRESWPGELRVKVRMALHTGEADQRGGDYYGPVVNRCARLRGIAHGGQILLSSATQQIVQDSLATELTLRSCGQHRLKDLDRSESVYQLHGAGLPAEFPPLYSLDNTELLSNLPPQLTSFIGREKELGEIKDLLAKGRVLTLTGSGGCGKTRLAIQTASDLQADWPDGVWMVELAALGDVSLVVQSATMALGVAEIPGQPILKTLTDYLAVRRTILILDYCEHLLNACAEFADTVIRRCPRVTILATSREALGIAGEQTYRVPSLSLPEPTPDQTVEDLSRSESVQLFIERASRARAGFRPADRNGRALASICRRLDGIPLAIELAAARVRTLSIEEIDSRLDQRFRLLTGGSRTALPRHQTLRSLIDWSFALLNREEQLLLQRLALFSGGWTLAAAEFVCGGHGIDEGDVLDLLTSIVEKSLAIMDSFDDGGRYRMLETVRQYARDRLLESPELPEYRNRHFWYFLDLVETAEPHLSTEDQLEWLARLDAERDNLRSAIEWSLSVEDGGSLALRLGAAMWRYWDLRFLRNEGRAYLSEVLAAAAGATASPQLASATYGAGKLAWFHGDFDHSQQRAEQSLALFGELDDREGVARSLNLLGNLANGRGDIDWSLRYHNQALAIRRELGDRAGEAASLNNLGVIRMLLNDPLGARNLLEESLAISQERGDRWSIAVALVNLGEVECELGNVESARRYLAECHQKARELGWPGNAYLLETLARIALVGSNPADAACLYGAAARIREVRVIPLSPAEQGRHDARVKATRAALGDEAYDSAFRKGRALSLEEVYRKVEELVQLDQARAGEPGADSPSANSGISPP